MAPRTLGRLAAARELADLLLPQHCTGCGRPGTGWCRPCATLLARSTPRRWTPEPAPEDFPPTWAALDYAGAVRRLVGAWKDAGRADLAAALAPPLRSALGALLADSALAQDALRATGRLVLVPAPSAASTVRARGDRPLVALTRLVCAPHQVRGRRLADPALVVRPVLRMTRHVADQAALDAVQRRHNLTGAMAVPTRARAELEGALVVVVDDVVTTGSTLAEAARALREAGAGGVLAATVAATARRCSPAQPNGLW